jgi:hypothetical protein
MKRLWNRIVCLFKGHTRWTPPGYSNWKFISWTDLNGDDVVLEICARCRRFYGDVA